MIAPVRFRVSLLVAIALSAAIGITGCGGGGGGGSPTVKISGTVTYDSVPATLSGLDYAATSAKPVRAAVIEVQDGAGVVVSRGNTSATGGYVLSAPPNTTVTIVVKAALGAPSAPDTKVIDNTNSNVLYALSRSFAVGAASATGVDLHAGSGWNGSSYTLLRAAGPFAILDTIQSCRLLVRSAAPRIAFPTLRVNWSVNNDGATIGTSYFDGSGDIFILGKADEDTDEYDDGVIAHEWGHYFEGNFSRSDSLGGSHGGSDILDETVAFGEGFGNAFSCMARGTPFYIDTGELGQAAILVDLDVEIDAQDDTANVGGRLRDGGWSETSVQELLWDIFDGGPGAPADSSEGDGVSLGFAPIYAVLVGPQRTTRSFTSIYSFMFHLKVRNRGARAAITTLEAAENVLVHDEFEQTGVGRRRYTPVANNGTPLISDVYGTALTTYTTYGPIGPQDFGNKLYNRMLFKVTAPSGGTLRIRAIPSGGSNDLGILAAVEGYYQDEFFAITETLDMPATAGQTVCFSVLSFNGAVPFSVRCGTAASVPKPSPAPVIPAGKG